MKLNLKGRRKPYSKRGIGRLLCVRCRKAQARAQWNTSICALGSKGRFVALCLDCDVALNNLVLEFFRTPNRKQLIKKYRQAQLAEREG